MEIEIYVPTVDGWFSNLPGTAEERREKLQETLNGMLTEYPDVNVKTDDGSFYLFSGDEKQIAYLLGSLTIKGYELQIAPPNEEDD